MASLADWRTQPLVTVSSSELAEEAMTYLEAVEVFRSEGCEPQWSREGEFDAEPLLTVPSEWPTGNVYGNIKSYLPPRESDGA